jgi:hypothetical protein
MMDILEVLKDDNEYYRGLGRNYLSNSDIGTLLNNPKMFKVAIEDNKAFAEGRYFHQSMIEPEKAKGLVTCDSATRTTKEYKKFCEDRNLAFALLTKEAEEIERLVGVMRNNMVFFDDIYRPDNMYEVPAIAEIHGMMWKGKADIVGKDMLIDLKTTSDIQKFKYSAKNYNYDSQCYIYQKLFGKPMVFFVIDKTTSQLGIFRPSDSFVAGGEEKVVRAIEVYQKFFGENPTDDIFSYYIDETL